MISLTIALALTGMMEPVQQASAASFNCAAAGLGKTEQTICGDPEVSALDSKLGSLYALARSKASDADKAGLITTQKAWISRRNQCADTGCLANVYNARIAELSSSATNPDSTTGSANKAAIASQPPQGSSTVHPEANRGTSKQDTSVSSAEISALAAEIEASASSARTLINQQIGFKDFRIGKVITTTHELPGLQGCSPIIELPKPGADMVNVDRTLHSRWDGVLAATVGCHVETTVLEKAVSVEIQLYGNPQTIGGIQLTVDTADLQTISDLLSKTLGPPQDKTTTETVDQVRAEIQQDELKQCEAVGESFRNSSALASQEVARCHQQVPGRVLMRMAQVPVDGIIQRTRFWSPAGALVGYQTINVGDHPTTQVTFNSSQTLATYQKVFAAISKDTEDQKVIAGKAQLAAKSKDF